MRFRNDKMRRIVRRDVNIVMKIVSFELKNLRGRHLTRKVKPTQGENRSDSLASTLEMSFASRGWISNSKTNFNSTLLLSSATGSPLCIVALRSFSTCQLVSVSFSQVSSHLCLGHLIQQNISFRINST